MFELPARSVVVWGLLTDSNGLLWCCAQTTLLSKSVVCAQRFSGDLPIETTYIEPSEDRKDMVTEVKARMIR